MLFSWLTFIAVFELCIPVKKWHVLKPGTPEQNHWNETTGMKQPEPPKQSKQNHQNHQNHRNIKIVCDNC